MRRMLIAFLLALASGTASAQPPARPTAPRVEPLAEIDALGRQGGRDAALRIRTLIQQGLSGPALSRAIGALARMGDRDAAGVLVTLVSHRRAAVRAQVAEALGRIGDARARPALADLLDDQDPAVRSAAAVALGSLGAQSVIETLVVATARGVPEAAIVLGEQAGAADVPRIVRRVDASTLPAFAPALRVLLDRANVPPRSKQALVRALAGIRTPECARLLREAAASLAPNDPLRATIQQALEQVTAQEAP